MTRDWRTSGTSIGGCSTSAEQERDRAAARSGARADRRGHRRDHRLPRALRRARRTTPRFWKGHRHRERRPRDDPRLDLARHHRARDRATAGRSRRRRRASTSGSPGSRQRPAARRSRPCCARRSGRATDRRRSTCRVGRGPGTFRRSIASARSCSRGSSRRSPIGSSGAPAAIASITRARSGTRLRCPEIIGRSAGVGAGPASCIATWRRSMSTC